MIKLESRLNNKIIPLLMAMNHSRFMIKCNCMFLQLVHLGGIVILVLGVPCCTYLFGVCHLVGCIEHIKVIIFLHAKKSFVHPQPIPHVKILRILCNIKSMSFINTNLNIFGICCPLGYNISNSLDVFFITHSIALAYLCFYHTYALPQMWTFIEACLATLGPFMSGSQGIWICLLVRLKSGPSPQRLLINFVLTILNRPYMVIFNPHYYSNYFIYL